MLPDIWGKHAWNFLHLVTIGYPEYPTEQDKQHYYDFFHSIRYILPCAKCRNNLTQHLEKYPLTDQVLSSKANLVKWLIDLHNVVNYYTGKPMIPYVEAMNNINNLTHPKKDNQTLYTILVIVAFILLCYLIYYYFIRGKNVKKLNY